ncbi:hypothetical protein PINS_up021268 [Pythium insidiosum]|nr:hypothetical protein PINS_up021268 [Pythium insidiosum]
MNVTTGIQNLQICFEMSFVAIAHHHAFPYEPYVGQPTSQRKSILADHLAIEDAMRDFDEVMPVVFPTLFKPHGSSVKNKRNSGTGNGPDVPPERVRLLSDDSKEHRAGDADPDALKRGWRL